ncbi:MAG: HIT family protein [Planctomycetota bacterium]|jgi:diadenosine tetraphosphate (Ap4A) HIT family hydrolase
MPNATIARFGYPKTLLHEYDHWVVLLRGDQVTAGCMVLACKEEALRLPDVSVDASAELPRVTGDLEAALRTSFSFDKINYLMLMMVDPHVHFHVIPRYATPREVGSASIEDHGWPRAPALGQTTDLTDEQRSQLQSLLVSSWPGA